MTLTSPVYWSPGLYRLTMRALYGDAFAPRYAAVADRIPDGARVIDLCCGCGYLYTDLLARRGIDYTGVDLLPAMTRQLRRRRVKVLHGSLLDLDLPRGDVCVLLGALYHFHPREPEVLRRMAEVAPRAILLEPVENLSQSASLPLRLMSHAATWIAGTSSAFRLSSLRLDEVLREAGVQVTSDTRVLGGKYRLIEFGRPAA